jgi:Flp pilus assembly protein TadG
MSRQHPVAALGAGLRLVLCRAGNVAVEFALALPVLIMLMLASAELARFVILHQKMDRVATTISDLVSRAETISESEMQDIFTAAGEVAYPFDLVDLGMVIVSSVTNPDGDGPIVAWQRSGGGSYSGSSQVGTEGNEATLTGDFEVREGETAIISEVYFDFAPFISDMIVAPQVIYRTAHHRPRLGKLEEIEEG